jgi:hypothetical protein
MQCWRDQQLGRLQLLLPTPICDLFLLVPFTLHLHVRTLECLASSLECTGSSCWPTTITASASSANSSQLSPMYVGWNAELVWLRVLFFDMVIE